MSLATGCIQHEVGDGLVECGGSTINERPGVRFDSDIEIWTGSGVKGGATHLGTSYFTVTTVSLIVRTTSIQ